MKRIETATGVMEQNRGGPVMLRMRSFRLDWDADYGIDHRRGWSVHIDGICYVQFARTAVGALIRAFWKRGREHPPSITGGRKS